MVKTEKEYRYLVGMGIYDAIGKIQEEWKLNRKTTAVSIGKHRDIYEFLNYDFGHLVLFTVNHEVTSIMLK